MAYIRIQEQSEPDTPPAGRITIYIDDTTGLLSSKNDLGVVSTYSNFPTTSAALAGVVSDETGTGSLVFANTPTLITPNIGNATGNVSGNAATATALQTARTINGVAFDGTTDITNIAEAITAATSKATPVDADTLGIADSAAANVLKKLTWANLKATLKTYFDTLYEPLKTETTLADQVITSAGLLTLAHGLSGTPKSLAFFLICQTAEFGFTAGDIVNANVNTDDGQDIGIAIVVDATNIRLRYGARATVFKEANFSTGARQNLTNANWRLRVHAAVKL